MKVNGSCVVMHGTTLLCLKTDTVKNKLIIPESANAETLMECEVIVIGPDCQNYRVGDTVRFMGGTGLPVHLDGKIYQVIDERNVIIGFRKEVKTAKIEA